MKFRNRQDAAEQLAKLIQVKEIDKTVVLALPRGGVPLGVVIAQQFNVPLDVILAKKIGHPMNSEYAIGAIAEGGEPVMNQSERVDDRWLQQEIKQINQQMQERRKQYKPVLPTQALEGKDVIIVDDGIATGRTVFAAIEALKEKQVNSIAVAVPIIPSETYHRLLEQVDYVYFIDVPKRFIGFVGAYYQDFKQVSDKEVFDLLQTVNN